MENIQLLNFFKRTDIRGTLIPIEAYKNVPFQIKRVFFIKDLDQYPRGFHAHKITEQVLFPITGSLKVDLTDGTTVNTYNLDKDNVGLYIPIDTWVKMYDYLPDTIICVLCSHEYDETEYMRNYGDFVKYVNTPNNKISCFDLSKQTQQLYPQIEKAVNNIIKTNAYVMGSELDTFEKNFAEYTGSKHCVGCSNGTSAMICALKALQLPPNSEIIVQSNTYIAAPLAIEACGHKIKIVDIDDTLGMDLDKLATTLTPQTKAVLIVHLYGGCVDMDRLLKLKEIHNFYLIEDCAQAHGSMFDNKHLGTFGEIGCYSFYPSKNLGSAGEGGCIITNTDCYADYIRKYVNYGSIQRYVWEVKGSNERMHNLQAAVLNVKLPYLDQWNAQRRDLAAEYDILLKDIPQVTIPNNHVKLIRNYHLYCILVDDRNELIKHLEQQEIHCAVHYPETFYKSAAFIEYNGQTFIADEIKHRIITLPMYPELEKVKVQRVCASIRAYYKL